MASPSGRSPVNSICRESRSGRCSRIPSPISTPRNRFAPKLGPFQSILDQIVADDQTAPPKQRHTADRHFVASATNMAIAAATPKCNATSSSTIAGNGRRLFRSGIFQANASKQTSAISTSISRTVVGWFRSWLRPGLTRITRSSWRFLRTHRGDPRGHGQGVRVLRVVPEEVWWDNPKTVATLICPGRQREIHPRYRALANHYAFNPQFCMPARGNEKPDAESTVKAVQRRFSTPVPRVTDHDELNRHFRDRCQAELARTVQSLSGHS